MPNSEVRRLKRSTKVTINPIYGQTKGYLEELRKEFNEAPERQEMLDRMEKARAARKPKLEENNGQ